MRGERFTQALVAIFAVTVWMTSAAMSQVTDFSFAQPIVIQLPNAHYPSDVAAGDLNGNGNLDLVVPGRNNDGIVHVLLGNGDGTFSGSQSFTVITQTNNAVLADFNGNGTLDLALTLRSFTGRVAVLIGNGDGTFSAEPDYYLVGRQPQSMVSSDLNGNGHIDLVVASHRSGTVRALFNNGDGTFTVQDPIFIEEYVTGLSLTHQIGVADINRDGAPDLAVTNLGTGRITVLLNDGQGNFTVDRSYRLPSLDGGPPQPSSMAVIADVSSDGNNELIATMARRIAVFPADEAGVLDPATTFAAATAGTAWAVALADFDGDGRPDVVVSTGGAQQLAFVKNVSQEGNVDFLGPMTMSSFIGFAFQVRPMDVNNNGVIDLVYPNIADHAVHVLLNTTPQAAIGSPRAARGDGRKLGGDMPPERSPSDIAGQDLREMLGILDTDTALEVLHKLESIGDKPRRESR